MCISMLKRCNVCISYESSHPYVINVWGSHLIKYSYFPSFVLLSLFTILSSYLYISFLTFFEFFLSCFICACFKVLKPILLQINSISDECQPSDEEHLSDLNVHVPGRAGANSGPTPGAVCQVCLTASIFLLNRFHAARGRSAGRAAHDALREEDAVCRQEQPREKDFNSSRSGRPGTGVWDVGGGGGGGGGVG